MVNALDHYATTLTILKQYSPEALCEKLTNAPWSPVLESFDVTEASNSFESIFTCVLDEIAPFSQVRLKQRTSPWIDEDLLMPLVKGTKSYRTTEVVKIQ